MIYLLYGIHVLICFFLILVVLLQQGKGADLSVFGGGGTMTAFGARGATTLLHKLTVFGFVGYIVMVLSIGILQTYSSSSSVMNTVAGEAGETAAGEDSGATEAGLGVDDGEDAAQEPLEGVFEEDQTESTTGETGSESSGDDPSAGDGDESGTDDS